MKKYIFTILFCLVILVNGNALASEVFLDINIPGYLMQVKSGDRLLYEFSVGVGRPDSKTPIGTFTIINKVINPTWYPFSGEEPIPAGPTNPLGGYWLGLSEKGYGIHGNVNPYSIGRPSSSGCIRMYNKDVELLYQLTRIGTEVVIRYETLLLINDGIDIKLIVLPDIYGYGTNNVSELLSLIEKSNLEKKVFIPYLINQLTEGKVGVFSIPLKIPVYYQGKSYEGIAFKLEKEIYLNPGEMHSLLVKEKTLERFLSKTPQIYVVLKEVKQKLSSNTFVLVQQNTVYFLNIDDSLQWTPKGD